jgi:hypothetical protein
LTTGGRTVMQPRERRLQRIVVGWQVAAAVVLLAGAALFVRSVQALDRTDVGFRAEGLLSMQVEPSLPELERWDAFYDGLRSRTREFESVANARTQGCVMDNQLGHDRRRSWNARGRPCS